MGFKRVHHLQMPKLGLGSFRFFLAFLVAISHLWEDMLHGPAAYAVWGFFVLSGFLMTLILTTKYGLHADGLKKYAFNRFLRIYPSYIIGCILGVVVLFLCNNFNIADSHALNPAFHLPKDVFSYICNIFMAPLGANGLLVPVAGALFVEVWAYMLMPFAAKSKSAAWLALILTFFANYQYGFDPGSFAIRYSSFATSIMGFFIGSLCWHYYEYLKRFSMPFISFLVWCIHAILWYVDVYYPWQYGIYISLFVSAWVVVSLFPIKTVKTDKILGDMSYLLYLLHTTVGMCVFPFYGGRNIDFFFVSFIITCILSYIMVVYFEHPLQRKFKLKA